ncbi:phosphate ABC transporter ATP-binding protein PstB [Lentilactobacillus sp. Marseille-Q4993]|uniref:phosphate ABC transporter ATP-binding protein PstB n=1 Tax=Lentilactobacillus sp. Marseille-Q4993 TaxID=3039492 RepID=UPI0024BC4432|nr:phosphate ABC transporter ATP-binding protein PstB [Lentilactobacillus sp. Marseille-Q4993]
MTDKIITSDGVRVYYGEKEAIHGVHIDIHEKQITALIGPSGCGKSTYLRCLNRMNDLMPNTTVTGSIKLQGEDIYAPKVDVVDLRKRVGMVFQQPNPFPFSIYENVAYGLRTDRKFSKDEIDQRVEESLKQAAIWDEVKDDLNKNALELSGGQQQRVCVARVLAVHPEVILLDEPTSALDPISSSKIEETLMAIRKDYTIVIVTHNMQQAARISDRTAFLLNGNLIEYSQTKQMFIKPEKEETSDYLNGKFG